MWPSWTDQSTLSYKGFFEGLRMSEFNWTLITKQFSQWDGSGVWLVEEPELDFPQSEALFFLLCLLSTPHPHSPRTHTSAPSNVPAANCVLFDVVYIWKLFWLPEMPQVSRSLWPESRLTELLAPEQNSSAIFAINASHTLILHFISVPSLSGKYLQG